MNSPSNDLMQNIEMTRIRNQLEELNKRILELEAKIKDLSENSKPIDLSTGK